ncbi:hypothetical protein HDU79_006864 [Rhizoclosmatium sp. JEL0117]|nr:hypothetical protein HDU79_006864 [Rhizoclosmatium sp. JEL0117]
MPSSPYEPTFKDKYIESLEEHCNMSDALRAAETVSHALEKDVAALQKDIQILRSLLQSNTKKRPSESHPAPPAKKPTPSQKQQQHQQHPSTASSSRTATPSNLSPQQQGGSGVPKFMPNYVPSAIAKSLDFTLAPPPDVLPNGAVNSDRLRAWTDVLRAKYPTFKRTSPAMSKSAKEFMVPRNDGGKVYVAALTGDVHQHRSSFRMPSSISSSHLTSSSLYSNSSATITSSTSRTDPASALASLAISSSSPSSSSSVDYSHHSNGLSSGGGGNSGYPINNSNNGYNNNYKPHGVTMVTPTTIIHSKKTTIHVSNIVLNRAQLRLHFREYEGFRRISFHQDYVFVCFGDVVTAANAITRIHTETDMNAAYAKHGVASNSTPTLQVAPNPILFVSIFPCFGEAELLEIFSAYEGFDSCRFFPMHALVRFTNLETAKRALEDLNLTTNLFANYSTKSTKNVNDQKPRIPSRLTQDPIALDLSQGNMMMPKIPGQPPQMQQLHLQQQQQQQSLLSPSASSNTSASAPKCTIHVTNLDKDIPTLLQFFKTLPGFARVAFYIDYAFVIFKDSDSASMAIETILFGSRMKANFARSDYTPHIVPHSALGPPSCLVRISDYPSTTTEEDLRLLLDTFPGVTGLNVFHSSCLVQFESIEAASGLVDELNGCTNLTCVFGKRKGSGSGLFGVSGVSAGGVGQSVVGGNMNGSEDMFIGGGGGGFEYGGDMGMMQHQQQQLYMGGAVEKESNAFESMFPALGSNGDLYQQQQQQQKYAQPQQMHMVSQRSSLPALISESEINDRRNAMMIGGGVVRPGSGGPMSKMSIPPGFGHLNNQQQSAFYGQQQQQQQQQLNGMAGHPLHQSNNAATILQPRATSFPSLSTFANSNTTNGNNAFGNLYNPHDSLQQQQQPQQQQQQQQMPLRHLNSSQGLYTSYDHQSNSEFLGNNSADDEFQQLFAPSSATPPPPGIGHSFQKTMAPPKRHSLKPQPPSGMGGLVGNVSGSVVGGSGLSTPPPTPFSRTSSPLYPMNPAASSVNGSNGSMDPLAARLAQLEAENAALRRGRLSSGGSSLSMASSSAVTLAAGPTSASPTSEHLFSAAMSNGGAAGSGSGLGVLTTQSSGTASVADSSPASPVLSEESRRAALVKSLLVKIGGGSVGASDEDDGSANATETAEINDDEVDWKASFEAAVSELMKAKQVSVTQKADFEKFQALHKNCGFLQGLLNICD